MSSPLYRAGRNWSAEASRLRQAGVSLPVSPTQARLQAASLYDTFSNTQLTDWFRRRRNAEANRQKLSGMRRTGGMGSNMQIAMPKVRQPLGTLADKGIPFNVEDEEELKQIRHWCNTPDAPVWMADYTFKNIGDITPGEQVIGWTTDETRFGSGRRQLVPSTVLAVNRREAPEVVRITFESGRTVQCTPDHEWLRYYIPGKDGKCYGGKRADSDYAPLEVGSVARHVITPVEPLTDPKQIEAAHYLAGMIDADGCWKDRTLTIAQSETANPAVCARIEASLNALDLQWHKMPSARSQGRFGSDVSVWVIRSVREKTRQSIVNLFNWSHPEKMTQERMDATLLSRNFGEPDKVVSVESLGPGEVVSMQTTTGNYTAWGYASKNCRLFYATHDLVPLLIDIYSKFPVVGMEFDSKDPLIKKFYEDMFLGNDLNYLEFLPDQFGREYFTVGEVTSLAHFNESLGIWSSEEILNPDMLRISRSLFVQRDRVQLLVKDLVDNLRQGPMSEGSSLSSTEETPSERLQRTHEYCFVPETRVLTEALEWVPVGSLAVGDKLVAFDEYGDDTTRTGRRWRGADVTATSIIQAPCYEVRTSDGTVTCTDQHKFLARRAVPGTGRGNNRGNGRTVLRWQWIEAQDLRPGDEIKHMPTWEFNDSFEAGWLSGIFDGEGSLSVSETSQSLVVYQNRGPVLDRIIDVLERHKFAFTQQVSDTRGQGVQIYIKGGITEVMRFLGVFRPERLSPKITEKFYGRPLASKCVTPVQVVSSEFVGTRDVVALATSTKTLIAEGLFSHNTELQKYYPEIIQAAAQNDGLDISEALISRVVNRPTPWAKRGAPHLLRSFRTLMIEESLNAAQDAVADRLYSPLILATLGIEDMGDGVPWIPDQDELDDARDDMQTALAADFRLMVHNFGLKVENVFGREAVPNLDADYERVERKLLQAWGIGEALISGGTGGAYASSALNREFVTQIMTGFQNALKRHIIKRAQVVAEAQGHYDYDLKGGVRVPIYREIVEVDEETGKEYIRKVPQLIVDDPGFVKFSTLNLRDEAQERAFIAQLKGMGVPVSDKMLSMNIEIELDQELERSADEAVQKMMATAQAMKKVQDLCDAQNLPYPPELAQHLMATLQLRQGKTQTELGEAQAEAGEAQAQLQEEQIEMQKVMLDQQLSGGAMPGQPMMPPGVAGPPPGGPPPGPPPQGGTPAPPGGNGGVPGGPPPGASPMSGPMVPGPGAPGPGMPPAGQLVAGRTFEAGVSDFFQAGVGTVNGPQATPPAATPPAGPAGPELPPGVPEPTEVPRNRQRPMESDEQQGTGPKQVGASRRKRTRKGVEERQPSRFETGPSSYGRSKTASEEEVETHVRRLEAVANWDWQGKVPSVADLIRDPNFYRVTNMDAYRGQLQADWPEIQAGGALDSRRILEDMVKQFTDYFGVEPQW